MSNMKVTDDWLYQYMPVVDEALIRGIEDSTDYEYQFSEQFEKKMEQLIRRERRDARKGRWKAFTGRLMQNLRNVRRLYGGSRSLRRSADPDRRFAETAGKQGYSRLSPGSGKSGSRDRLPGEIPGLYAGWLPSRFGAGRWNLI